MTTTYYCATRISSQTGERAAVARGFENNADFILEHMNTAVPKGITHDHLLFFVREMMYHKFFYMRIYSFASIYSAFDFHISPLPTMTYDIFCADPIDVQSQWNQKKTMAIYSFAPFAVVLSKFKQGVLCHPANLSFSEERKN